MRTYVLRRLALAVPVLIGASILIFLMARLMPGDVVDIMVAAEPGMTPEQAATLRRLLGLDMPIYAQYLNWIGDLLAGNFGSSLYSRRTVAAILGPAIPITVELALLSTVLSLLFAIPAGIISAVRANSVFDYIVRTISLLGLATPHFFFAILLLLVFSKFLGWLPPLFYVSFQENPMANLGQMALPSITLAWGLVASTSRMLRSTMLETLFQEYILTARAKGLAGRVVLVRHALKNALIPVVTIVGLQIGNLLGGALIVEQIFGLPGVGWALVQAIFQRDYAVMQTAVVLLTITYLLVNLFVDILYAYLDPRIRFT